MIRAARRPAPALKRKVMLGAVMRRAAVLESDERDFRRLVQATESNPLFHELLRLGALRRSRFPGVSPAFFRRVDSEAAPAGTFATAPAPGEIPGAADLLSRIGTADIQRFFLAPDRLYRQAEIARLTGLDSGEVRRAADLLNRLLGVSPAAPPLPAAPPPPRVTSVIARLSVNDGRLLIGDFSLDLARGRYLLDQALISRLRASLDRAGRHRLGTLLERLARINARRSTIYRVITALAGRQAAFLASGDPGRLCPLTQRQLGVELALDPGVLSRTIAHRAVETADGTIIALKTLFPGRAPVVSALIRRLEAEQPAPRLSDRQISCLLAERAGLTVPRRTVNFYRRRPGPAAASGKRECAGSS